MLSASALKYRPAGTDRVRVERVSCLDRKPDQLTLNCSVHAFETGMERCQTGALMQDALPMLSREEREFLISGITPPVWNKLFPPLPPLNQERVEHLLAEYIPVMEECFGGTTDRPLNTQELTHAIVYDYPGTPDELKEHVNKWVIAWASQQGYTLYGQ